MELIKVLIADDHAILRAALKALISPQPGFKVVGEAADGSEVLRVAQAVKPDVILLDISMPEMCGIAITTQLKELLPQTKVLILTVHEDKGLLEESIQAGASGYLLKRALKGELFNAIYTVMRGEHYIHSEMIRLVFKEKTPKVAVHEDDLKKLTRREIEVLTLLAQGYTNSQISEQLYISLRTVEFHRSNLVGKLNLTSRVDIVRYATEHGLVGSKPVDKE